MKASFGHINNSTCPLLIQVATAFSNAFQSTIPGQTKLIIINREFIKAMLKELRVSEKIYNAKSSDSINV